jgi:hypothetical protein
LILFIGMIFMPFSPRWLVHHDREDEARKVLAHLRDLPIDHELVELEFLEIKAQSLFEKRTVAEHFPHLREQTSWNTFKLQFVAIKSLFKSKAMFKRVIVATVTMFFQVCLLMENTAVFPTSVPDCQANVSYSNGRASTPSCTTHRPSSRLWE